MQADHHRPSEFIAPHLFLQVLLSLSAFAIVPFSALSLALPMIIALLPLPLCFVPSTSKVVARTYLHSVGAALLCGLLIYAVGVAAIFWMLRDMTIGW